MHLLMDGCPLTPHFPNRAWRPGPEMQEVSILFSPMARPF